MPKLAPAHKPATPRKSNVRKAAVSPQSRTAEARQLAEKALDALKGQDIVLINLEGKATFADCMLVATATSSRHAASLASNVEEALGKGGFHINSVQGQRAGEWVLVDAGDLIVHIFQPEFRRLYNLEKLWSF